MQFSPKLKSKKLIFDGVLYVLTSVINLCPWILLKTFCMRCVNSTIVCETPFERAVINLHFSGKKSLNFLAFSLNQVLFISQNSSLLLLLLSCISYVLPTLSVCGQPFGSGSGSVQTTRGRGVDSQIFPKKMLARVKNKKMSQKLLSSHR